MFFESVSLMAIGALLFVASLKTRPTERDDRGFERHKSSDWHSAIELVGILAFGSGFTMLAYSFGVGVFFGD
jgi:hypothetical protein